MSKDNRDPSAIGEKLIKDSMIVRNTYGEKIPLTEIWDLHVSKFVLPDYQDEQTSIEKYGSPKDVKARYMRIRVR